MIKKHFIVLFILFAAMPAFSSEDWIDGKAYENFDVTDWGEMSAPGVSAAGSGRIYFDSTADVFKVSENGGAYANLVGGGGGDVVTVNSVAVDTTANIKDGTDITWTLTDGGAGGPDDIAGTVVDDSHAHTGASLSGVDISADTNLAVTVPIVLTEDTLSITRANATQDGYYNSTEWTNSRKGGFGFKVGDSSNAINASDTNGWNNTITMPYAGTITGWACRETNNLTGNFTIDIHKADNDTDTTFATIVSNGIMPTIANSSIGSGTNMTNWTTAVAAGETFKVVYNASDTVKRVVTTIYVTKT